MEVLGGKETAGRMEDESGRKTIWRGKYLPIHLPERDSATHLCRVCVCSYEMIMCGTLGLE